ncbi:MAG: hypothetical protein ACI9N0_001589 [Ilumatobacter sp.]
MHSIAVLDVDDPQAAGVVRDVRTSWGLQRHRHLVYRQITGIGCTGGVVCFGNGVRVEFGHLAGSRIGRGVVEVDIAPTVELRLERHAVAGRAEFDVGLLRCEGVNQHARCVGISGTEQGQTLLAGVTPKVGMSPSTLMPSLALQASDPSRLKISTALYPPAAMTLATLPWLREAGVSIEALQAQPGHLS